MRLIAKATAAVHPTEDEEKIIQLLLNIFPRASIVKREREIVAEIDSPEGLERLRMMIRARRIRNTVRSLLSKGVRDNRVIFYLNKQAAMVGKLSFYEAGEVVALGPVEVVIETDNPSNLIEWLTE